MKGKFTYKKLIRIRRELAGFMVPIGTVPTNLFPSKEELDRWNALPRRIDKHPMRFDTKGNFIDTPMCPRCNRAMKRQPKGGLRCGRDDCHISP